MRVSRGPKTLALNPYPLQETQASLGTPQSDGPLEVRGRGRFSSGVPISGSAAQLEDKSSTAGRVLTWVP